MQILPSYILLILLQCGTIFNVLFISLFWKFEYPMGVIYFPVPVQFGYSHECKVRLDEIEHNGAETVVKVCLPKFNISCLVHQYTPRVGFGTANQYVGGYDQK